MTLNGLTVSNNPLAATTTPTLFYRAANGSLINTAANAQQLAAYAVTQQLTTGNQTSPVNQTSSSPPNTQAQTNLNATLNGQRYLRPTSQQQPQLVQQAAQLQQQQLQNSLNLQNHFVNLAALANQQQSLPFQQQQQQQHQSNSVLAALTAAVNAQRQNQFNAQTGAISLPPGYALYAQPDGQLIGHHHDPRFNQLIQQSSHQFAHQLNVNPFDSDFYNSNENQDLNESQASFHRYDFRTQSF